MKPGESHADSMFVRVHAAAIVDGDGTCFAPGSILIEARPVADAAGWHSRTLAVGTPAQVSQHPANSVPAPRLRTINRPRSILLPGFVNAHTHLDLTHIGPRPHAPDDGFVPWVTMVRSERHSEPALIAASVRSGIDLSLAAGTVAIGDIAGAPKAKPSLVPGETMSQCDVRGVSFLEFFAIGNGEAGGLTAIDEALERAAGTPLSGVRFGLQPHAPNTVAEPAYRASIRRARELLGLDVPISTHLAETREEREFVTRGTGAQRQMLESLGIWTDSILEHLGRGRHPVEHLAQVLSDGPILAAHVNDADDRTIELLAGTGTRVVYCPHASRYFGAPDRLGPHRYRDMLEAGVPVALGTDSIINLPAVSNQPEVGMSVLREARLLRKQDGTDPGLLLRLLTRNGAIALRMDPKAFCFEDGFPVAGLVAIDLAEHQLEGLSRAGAAAAMVMDGNGRPFLLCRDTGSGFTVTTATNPV